MISMLVPSFVFVVSVELRHPGRDISRSVRKKKVALTENGSTTLPLVADHTTHGVCLYSNKS
jgi:hypothetical protein